MTDTPQTQLAAPAKVAIALKAAGWREVDGVPWLWCRGGEAVSWEEAVGMSVSAPAPSTPDPANVILRILTSKELLTAVPVVAGVVLDLIPVITPWATGLAAPWGTVVGTALGTLSRSLSSKLKQGGKA